MGTRGQKGRKVKIPPFNKLKISSHIEIIKTIYPSCKQNNIVD